MKNFAGKYADIPDFSEFVLQDVQNSCFLCKFANGCYKESAIFVVIILIMNMGIIRFLTIVSLLYAGCSGAAAQENKEKGGNAAADPVGTLSYCLPMTSLSFEVEAVRENFYAGPYAAFAKKYLGIDVRQEDAVSYRLTKVKMTPYAEADQSCRYLLKVGAQGVDASFLKLTSCGLVSMSDAAYGTESVWRFPTEVEGDFSDDGLISNVASESTTLYRNVKGESAYSRVAVQQEVMVAKTPEKKAAETAAMIFELRRQRIKIITGDTDATYSGEAMGAAVAEITRLEKEYMTMFTGYSVSSVQSMKYEMVPEKDRTMYVVFRISDTDGLLPADNLAGKPVLLEIVPAAVPQPSNPVEKKSEEKKLGKDVIYATYRVPAVCTLRLTDGTGQLLSARLPVYQYGYDSTFPLSVIVK